MIGFMGVEQVARKLGVHGDTVKRLIASGRLPAAKLLGRWRIAEDDLERVLERPGEEARDAWASMPACSRRGGRRACNERRVK